MVVYPNLVSAMAVREISKESIANSIGISSRAFRNKLAGKTAFKLQEAEKIQSEFFSDISILDLFARADDARDSA